MFEHPETKKIIQDAFDGEIYDALIAKTKNYKPNVYYRVEGTGLDYSGVGRGLYLGKDKKALKAFYSMEQDLPIREFHGEPKWLDLVEYKDYKAFEKEAKNKFGEHEKGAADHLKKLALERGYDGIRYYDPLATGEEFVLFNVDKVKEK